MSEGRFSPVCFLSAAVSAEFLIKANEEKKKSFRASKFAASDRVRALEETFSRAEWQELKWTTSHWNGFTNFPLSQSPPESWMRYGVSLREKKKEHCGAIMRADCEVRVGTVSEGMSRLARLVLLQRRGCMFERIHLRIEISRPFVWQIPGSLFLSDGGLSARGQRSLPYQTVEAGHLRETEVLDR